MIDYSVMTDEEFEIQMQFEKWCDDQKYNTKQKVHLMEAFEVFEDNIFDLCIEHLSDAKLGKEEKAHFEEILNKFKKWKARDEELQIEQAKAYPIDQLVRQFSDEKREITFKRNVRCILHEERTASMRLYPNNTFYCFGCGQGGDTIKLLMGKRGVDFISAVKWLTNS